MTGTQQKSAEGRAQLEAKAVMDSLMSNKLQEIRALSTAHDGQASQSCKGSQVGVHRSPRGRAGGVRSGESTLGMVWTVPSAQARTSGAYIKIVSMSAISSSASLQRLEGLKLKLSSKYCSLAMQHAWEGSSEGSFDA